MNNIFMQVKKLNISGNIIPQNWFNFIKRGKRQTPDLIAMWILADILYWYRPTEIRDENTGELIEYRKKIKSDKLQKSYSSYADLLGIPKKTMKEHFKILKNLNLIDIEFRSVKLNNGMVMNNVMFIEPKIKEIEKYTYPKKDVNIIQNRDIPITQKGIDPTTEIGIDPTTEIGKAPITQKGIDHYSKLGNTNTENTTEITIQENTTKNTYIDKSSSKFFNSKNEFNYFKDTELNNLMNEYLKFRKTKRLSNSDIVIKRLSNKLKDLYSKGYNPHDIVMNALTNGWKDFYEPKISSVGNSDNAFMQKAKNSIDEFVKGE